MEFVNGLEYPREIGELFREYTEMLVEGDPKFQIYLELQNYEEELQHLEGKYGPPGGKLILACEDGEAAGCIALKQMDEPERCEPAGRAPPVCCGRDCVKGLCPFAGRAPPVCCGRDWVKGLCPFAGRGPPVCRGPDWVKGLCPFAGRGLPACGGRD